MSRAPWIVTGAVVLVAGVAVTASFGVLGLGVDGVAGSAATPTKRPETAKVTRTTLVATTDIDGTLAYPEPTDVTGGQGIITEVPADGDTIERGEALFRVDTEPVMLLYGPVPAYRTLEEGIEGADVEQFEQNLRALGYDGFDVDNEYTSYTADAVAEWQDDCGLPETGRLDLGQVTYADGKVRIAEVHVGKGESAGAGPVISYDRGQRHVTAKLDVAEQDFVEVGAVVVVELPSGDSVTGTIIDVGTKLTNDSDDQSTSGQSTEEAQLELTIALESQQALGNLEEAPVTVTLRSDERRDVLTVPVSALLALREGGYGVEVVEGKATKTVAVELGMFADGRVEVSSPDLEEGMEVGVASR